MRINREMLEHLANMAGMEQAVQLTKCKSCEVEMGRVKFTGGFVGFQCPDCGHRQPDLLNPESLGSYYCACKLCRA